MGQDEGGFQRRNGEGAQGQEVFPRGNTRGESGEMIPHGINSDEVDAELPLSGGVESTPPSQAELHEDAPAQATSSPDTDAHPGLAPLPPPGCDQAPKGQQAPHLTDCDGQAGLQELAGCATLLFYMSEEGQEGRNAYLEKRAPEFGQFTRHP